MRRAEAAGSVGRRARTGVVTAVLATVVVVALAPPASSQAVRPPCSDGAGNVRDQIQGEIIDAILPDWLDHPWGPEAPADLWDRCMEPHFRQVPGPASGGGPSGPGSGWGDPHLVTHDGLAYDLQAAGDVVVLEAEDAGLVVQGRFHRTGSITWVDGVAARSDVEGGVTVAVDGLYRDAVATVTVDGAEVDLGDLGWVEVAGGVVHRADGTTTIVFDDGAGVRAGRATFEVAIPPGWAGDVRGILGDGDGDAANDLVGRDGTPVDTSDPDAVYGPWLDDWLVGDGDSLFPVPFADDWGPTRPDDVLTLADLPSGDVAEAAATCGDAGLAPGGGLEQCTFDVAVTGDVGRALAGPAGLSTRGTVPASALDPVVDAKAALATGDEVGPDTPVEGAGILDGPDDVDEFTLEAADTVRWLVPIEPCSAPLAAVALVVVDTRVFTSHPLTCGQAHPLPTGATTLRLVDPSGAGRDYGFRVSDQPDPFGGGASVVTATTGVPVDLVATEPGAFPTAAVDLAMGQRIYVEVLAEVPSELEVAAPDGEVVTRFFPFDGSDVVEVDRDGPWTVSVDPIGDAVGTTTVVVHDVPDDVVASAAVGDDVELDLTTPGQVARVEVDLRAGEVVDVVTRERMAGTYHLEAPDGTEVATWPSFASSGAVDAAAAGTHTIVFDPFGATVGRLSFTVEPG